MYHQRRLVYLVRATLRNMWTLALFIPCPLLADDVTFDTSILQNRGLSEDLNRYFSKAPRFLPGIHSVQVKVNDKDRGTAAVRFGEDGSLCIDSDFLGFAGLMPVPLRSGEPCHDITSDYPQAVVSALPNKEMVALYLPKEALSGLSDEIKNFQHGGTAALMNYSIFSTQSKNDGGDSNRYSQASLEGGLNIADWALRSSNILTDNNGSKNAETIYTYAEHVFAAHRMTMQVGEINAISDVLSGVSITGVQLFPTSELRGSASGVKVSGIARNAQARVEVRQSGQLIYNTLVPAGPFTLEDVPIVRNNVDLDVSVIESDGSTSRFVVPAASIRMPLLSRPRGLSVSVGQVRNNSGDYDNPWVANISDGWRLLPWLNLLASGTVTDSYVASGVRTEYQLTETWNASTSVAASQEKYGSKSNGVKTELQSSVSLGEALNLSASASHYTHGYRELSDALDNDFQPYDNMYTANLAWSVPVVGTFNAGLSYNQSGGEGDDSRYLMLSWGKTFKYASISVNWQSAIGNVDSDQDDEMLYINLNIPLGGSQSINSYMRKQGDQMSYGLQNSGRLTQNTNYYIAVDRDNDDNENSFNGNLTSNLRYTQLGIGGGSTDNQRNYNATLSGGIAVHKSGVTFSPYTIRDTFAIAKLNEKKSGVEIATPQGTIWTDFWGQAVIPGLNEWRNSRIEINANKLPASMTLANGVKYVAAAHASVSELNFKVINSRRVMIRVKRADGSALPRGLSIVDEKQNYIVTSVDDGHVFLNEAEQVNELYATDEKQNRLCRIQYTLSDDRDEEAFYEEVEGVCQ